MCSPLRSIDPNDRIGPLHGHPQVKPPQHDRLALGGHRVYQSSALCGPDLCILSRAAVFGGRQPFETGVYYNDLQYSDRAARALYR